MDLWGFSIFGAPVQNGSEDYPAEGDVRKDISYGNGSYVGNMSLPAVSNVRLGTRYGESGTEYIGTYGLPNTLNVPQLNAEVIYLQAGQINVSSRVYAGDVGTNLVIDMKQEMNNVTSIVINVKKPDGSRSVWNPIILNKQYLLYTLQTHDIDLYGIYYLQPFITIGSWNGFGDTVQLRVSKKFT